MTADRARLVQELRGVMALVEKATPGPWHYCGSHTCAGVGAPDSQGRAGTFQLVAGEMTRSDANAVYAAVNFLRDNSEAIAAAIEGAGAEVERAQSEERRWRGEAFTASNRKIEAIAKAERLAEALRLASSELNDYAVDCLNGRDFEFILYWSKRLTILAQPPALAASSADGEG